MQRKTSKIQMSLPYIYSYVKIHTKIGTGFRNEKNNSFLVFYQWVIKFLFYLVFVFLFIILFCFVLFSLFVEVKVLSIAVNTFSPGPHRRIIKEFAKGDRILEMSAQNVFKKKKRSRIHRKCFLLHMLSYYHL